MRSSIGARVISCSVQFVAFFCPARTPHVLMIRYYSIDFRFENAWWRMHVPADQLVSEYPKVRCIHVQATVVSNSLSLIYTLLQIKVSPEGNSGPDGVYKPNEWFIIENI